jgi:hypothetical protein
MRRFVAVGVLISALLVAATGVAVAQEAAPMPVPVDATPECSPRLDVAVLQAVAGLVAPGTVIPYFKIRLDPAAGIYAIGPCVVTVPIAIPLPVPALP